MDVYIWGPDDDTSRFLKCEFQTLSRIIMCHQPVDLERVSSQDRFNIAMKLRLRFPKDFLATVGLEHKDQLPNLTDESGATVLHWAAQQWSVGHRCGWPSAWLTLYEDFIVSLVKAGSVVSAIDMHGHSPLMYLLDGDHVPGMWSNKTWSIPGGLCPVQLVRAWTNLLVQAGRSLPEYIDSENELLSHLDSEHTVSWLWRGQELELEHLALGNDMTLRIHVHTTKRCAIWESQPPPGAFVDSKPSPRRLWWYPPEDDPDGFWQPIELRMLKSSEPFMLSPDSINDVEFDLGQILFGGTQDDHMTLAAVYRREQRRFDRSRKGLSSRRRSSSTPPATRTFVEFMTHVPHPHRFKFLPFVHKCPLDSQWGFCGPSRGRPDDMWATCMAGCSGRPNHGANIAAAFLPQEKSLMTPRERWLVDEFPSIYGSESDL